MRRPPLPRLVRPAPRLQTDTTTDTQSEAPHGILEGLHGHANVRTPLLRLLRNNALGVFLHICFMAWWALASLRAGRFALSAQGAT